MHAEISVVTGNFRIGCLLMDENK